MPSKKRLTPVNVAASHAAISDQDHLGLERLIFFSDAVFAIAVTLLALEIRLPVGSEEFNDTQLLASLLGLSHKYLAYVMSFLVIGTFWISHHRKFRLITRYDNRLLSLNLLILMVVAFIPFPSAVVSDNGNRTATIFYALIMILAGLLFIVLWWYAARHNRLTAPSLTQQQRRREFAVPLATMTIFLISIAVAFFDEGLARLSWLLILPATLFVSRNNQW